MRVGAQEESSEPRMPCHPRERGGQETGNQRLFLEGTGILRNSQGYLLWNQPLGFRVGRSGGLGCLLNQFAFVLREHDDGRMHLECLGELLCPPFADINTVVLEQADILRVDAGLPRQFLLRPALQFAQDSDRLSSGDGGMLPGTHEIIFLCLHVPPLRTRSG